MCGGRSSQLSHSACVDVMVGFVDCAGTVRATVIRVWGDIAGLGLSPTPQGDGRARRTVY